jgi:hypothetical protein
MLSTMNTSIGGRFGDGREGVIEEVGGGVLAVLVARLLAQALAHAHPDRALHLAFDAQRVDGETAIERGPDLVHGDLRPVSGSTLTSTDLRGIGETHGGADGAAAVLAALEFDRAGEGALDVQRAGIHQRLGGGVAEADGAVRIAGDVEGSRPCSPPAPGATLKATRGGLDQDLLEVAAPRRGRRCRP